MPKKKHKLKVTLIAISEVEIEVDVEEGDEPTDITDEEEQQALAKGPSFPAWEVDSVELLPTRG